MSFRLSGFMIEASLLLLFYSSKNWFQTMTDPDFLLYSLIHVLSIGLNSEIISEAGMVEESYDRI